MAATGPPLGGSGIGREGGSALDDIKIYRGPRVLNASDISTLMAGDDIPSCPTPGTYTVTYSVTDYWGNTATETRTVIVVGAVSPVINSITVSGTTVSCTLTGKADTTYGIFSSLDIESGFTTPETTVPAAVITDGTGAASFTIDVTGRNEFHLRAEQQ